MDDRKLDHMYATVIRMDVRLQAVEKDVKKLADVPTRLAVLEEKTERQGKFVWGAVIATCTAALASLKLLVFKGS